MTGLRPLSIGEILDGAFSIYRRHFVVMITTAGVLTLPGTLAQVAFPNAGSVLTSIGTVIALVALTGQTSDALLGGQPDLASGLQFGMRRTGAALTALLLTYLLIGLVSVPFVGIGWYVAVTMKPDQSGLSLPAFLLLMMSIVLVGVTVISYLMLRWFAVMQIAVLEPTRRFLRRSAVLSRGALWKISVVWLVGTLIVGVPSSIAGIGQGVATVMNEGGSSTLLAMSLAIGWIISTLGTPFTAALLTLLYYDQRVRKDGLDVELAVSRAVAPPVPQPVGT
jgi:hypothetical protein